MQDVVEVPILQGKEAYLHSVVDSGLEVETWEDMTEEWKRLTKERTQNFDREMKK